MIPNHLTEYLTPGIDLRTDLSGCTELERIKLPGLRDSKSVEDEIRQRMETERAMIDVALGYVRAGQNDAAGLILKELGK